jgi:poly-gamma-glutamate synthesis protein (capsule biosynthesis protein)
VGDCSTFNRENLSPTNLDPDLASMIGQADVFIFNLEGPIVNKEIVTKGPIKNPFIKFALKQIRKLQPVVISSETLLDVLKLAKHNVACLANNHILDAGPEAIINTIQMLSNKGFQCLGAGENIRQAQRTLTIDINNSKIAVANYNFIGWRKAGLFVNIFGAKKKKAGANYASRENIKHQLTNLAENSDYTIAVFHIGREMKQNLEHQDTDFLTTLPADLIVTHHAHIKQNVNSKKIFSCGDFIFKYSEHLPDNRKSNLIQVIGDKIIQHPLTIKDGLPYLDQKET